MAAAGLLTLFYLALAFLQPFIPAIAGQKWLIGMAPLLLAYAALRIDGLGLILFILIGGCVHDLLLLHYVGFGPLLWGCTVFIVTSQAPMLRDSGLFVSALTGFIASFFYNSFDRLLYLVYHSFWSWDLDLSYAILWQSLINAVLCPILFAFFDVFKHQKLPKRSTAYRLQ
ncbi:MAG: hypothetical protein ACFCUX_06555 [Candidatus Methylacidiphilales bacterium]